MQRPMLTSSGVYDSANGCKCRVCGYNPPPKPDSEARINRMKNVLVTGGAGFIGSNFVRRMLENHPDYRVLAYDKLTYAGNLDNLESVTQDPNYKFVQGDIANRDSVRGV